MSQSRFHTYKASALWSVFVYVSMPKGCLEGDVCLESTGKVWSGPGSLNRLRPPVSRPTSDRCLSRRDLLGEPYDLGKRS